MEFNYNNNYQAIIDIGGAKQVCHYGASGYRGDYREYLSLKKHKSHLESLEELHQP